MKAKVMRLIRIGRDEFNEARLGDATVSRRHAELLVLPDDRLYLSDCNSTSGTFMRTNSGWEPVRQTFVEYGTQLKFGEHNVVVDELVR